MTEQPVGDHLRIVRADAGRWDDVTTVFGTRGDPSWCWCQYFLTTGRGYEKSAQHNREALRREVASDDPERSVGLIAYLDDDPVGWVQLGPRGRFPRVTGSRGQQAVLADAGLDAEGAWRVTCFVVRVGHRRQGVATALLDAAVEHARADGARVVEGHAVDDAARASRRAGGSELYPGVLSMFLAAGFHEVGRTSATRAVVARTV
ncbi:GNAT family N-acetyltransferase [Actinotalea sp. M2MS4P-6]|uniref:GNAT family N-acetyltransferase n=1 Tax=Actinotalea sp. M2MS4P-6 TaxID=2983762 RepID=UPI0021E46B45|nr:GNAT family N-acetyltransferase [Actinotalea sp. M2MS4P-6]MCV2393011.1 GNAT family N-acetyltransferase [Actinotalea sp. M2MS4P-6]